jgi:hypothetical protein
MKREGSVRRDRFGAGVFDEPVGSRREEDVAVACGESVAGSGVGVDEVLESADLLDAAPFVLGGDAGAEVASGLTALWVGEGVLGEDGLLSQDGAARSFVLEADVGFSGFELV